MNGLNPLQRKTAAIGCGLLTLLGFLVVAGLAWEVYVYGQSGDATFSRLIWQWWVASPWSVWLVSVVFAFVAGFLSGHFVAQSDAVYEAIRKGER